MKFFLFLVALANVGLFMWEYRQGAFDSSLDIAEHYVSPDQERILLVSELKERHQPRPEIQPEIVAQAPASETMLASAKDAQTVETRSLAEQLIAPAEDDPAPASAQLAAGSAEQPVEQKKAEAEQKKAEAEQKKAEAEQKKAEAEQKKAEAEQKKAETGQKKAETGQKKAETAQPEPVHADNAKSEPSASKPKTVQPAIVAVDKTPNSDNPPKAPAACYEAGPFANGTAYQLWKSELNAPKEAIKSLSRDGEVISDYLVYYPAAETKLQADANLKMLKDKGIRDLWILTKGEDKGLISLGVFKNESRALTLKSQLFAKGIQAEIKPRRIMKPQKYARIKTEGKVLERLKVMKQTYPAIAVKKINQCW